MARICTPQGICRFAVARRDITPPVGIYHRMWGAAVHDRAEGVHRPLTATVMLFAPAEDGDTRQVIVALDHCLLWHREMESFAARVCEATGIARRELLVTFSHTHAAGLLDLNRGDFPGGDLMAPYLAKLTKDVSAAITEALEGLQEVTIALATGRCDLAVERDYWDEGRGRYVCGPNPDGSADDTLLVARVTRDDGSLVATIVNYACHPTTLAWDNRLISPDYPGAMREVIETATGATSIFLQGASGDLGPREGFVGDAEVADRNGRQLGYAALAALESIPSPRTEFVYAGPVVSGAEIGVWQHRPVGGDRETEYRRWAQRGVTAELPLRDDLPTAADTRAELERWRDDERQAQAAGDHAGARDARAMAERMRRRLTRLDGLPGGGLFGYPITLLRTGQVFWLAVEGEPYQLLQRRLRERFPQITLVVMVLANGSRTSYLPTADKYGTGVYQETVAVLQQGCLEGVIDAAGKMIEESLAVEG